MQIHLKIVFLHLCVLRSIHASFARGPHLKRYIHQAFEALDRRDGDAKSPLPTPIEIPAQTSSSDRYIYTVVTPSPGAAPVSVTEQSQIVTSFVPQMTMCVGPAIQLIPITTMGPPYLNYSTATASGNGSCSTYYTATATTVCATTLTGLASRITISDCDQEVTFSSEYGYEMRTTIPAMASDSLITSAPGFQTVITYYMAPWQSLTVGDTPSHVDTKICTVLSDGNLDCAIYQEVWEVIVLTTTTTSTSNIDLVTTVSGPGVLKIETIHLNITATMTALSLSTSIVSETEFEFESTSRSTKSDQTAPVVSTMYITKAVHYASDRKHRDTTVYVTSKVTTHIPTVTSSGTAPRLFPTL